MSAFYGSSNSTARKRTRPRCRELRRHLDQFKDQLEKRGIRIEEVIDVEAFYCIHEGAEADYVEEDSLSEGPMRWKCDPDRLITTIEKGFDKVGVSLATLAQENESLKQNLAHQVGAIGKEVDPEYFHWILTILARVSWGRTKLNA